MLQDLHMHTKYCDGANTVEEMILAAIDAGLERMGLSGHSYTHFDESYCMSKDGVERYIAEVRSLAEKYADKIEVLCGIEQDFYSEEPVDRFDYVIGSVHYVKHGDLFLDVDHTEEITQRTVDTYFDGDYYAWAKAYFDTVADVVDKTNATIIGHFDLVAKFNEGNKYFDESDPRYLEPAFRAIEKLVSYGIPFEINTGAISRGYRSEPYPAKVFRDKIKELGGTLILSSDAHCANNIAYEFEKWASEI